MGKRKACDSDDEDWVPSRGEKAGMKRESTRRRKGPYQKLSLRVDDGDYVLEGKPARVNIVNTRGTIETRCSQLEYYNYLLRCKEEWDRLCAKTFDEMVRCCLCGACELGGTCEPTFEDYMLNENVLVDGKCPAEANNPDLYGTFEFQNQRGGRYWKMCKFCASNVEASMERTVNFNLANGQYLGWLYSCQSHERQWLQCVDIGYEFTEHGSGKTSRSKGYSMFLAPIVKSTAGAYNCNSDEMEMIGVHQASLIANQHAKTRIQPTTQKLLFYNIGNNPIYRTFKAISEVPDILGNRYISADVVQNILAKSRERNPLCYRKKSDKGRLIKQGQVDNPLNSSENDDQGLCDDQGNCLSCDEDNEDCSADEFDSTDILEQGNDPAQIPDNQDMILLATEPRYMRTLQSNSLLNVGKVYPRDEKAVLNLQGGPDGFTDTMVDDFPLTMESSLFPYLFPENRGQFVPSGKARICIAEFSKYLQNRMACLFSPFTLIPEYIFMMFQIMRVMQYTTSNQKYTLQKAYDNRIKTHPRESVHSRVKHLITYVLPKSVPFTPSWWRRKVNELRALVCKFSLPHYFLTLTVDDVSNIMWDEYKDIQEILDKSINSMRRSTNARGPDISAANAQVEAAALFHHRVSNFMEHCILGGVKALGDITHYVTRYEVQGRQALHAHILLWSTPESVAIHEHEITRDIQMEVGPSGSLVPPDPTVNPGKYFLHQIVRRKQTHTCNKLCRRPRSSCSWGFPNAIHTGQTELDEIGNCYRYKCPNYESRNIVEYHPLCLMLWNAHMCLKRVTSSDLSFYICKYCLKTEPVGRLNLNADIEKQLNMANIEPSVIKVVNGMTQTQAVSQVECGAICAGIPMLRIMVQFDESRYESPFLYLPVDPPERRKTMVNYTRGEIVSIMDKYENRPVIDELETITFPDYFEKYDVRAKELTSARYRSLFIGKDKKQRFVYRRDKQVIVHLGNQIPTEYPEGFFFRVLLVRVPFRTESYLLHNGSYYWKCQQLGIIENDEDVDAANVTKFSQVLEDYYRERCISQYSISTTIGEIRSHYASRGHAKQDEEHTRAFDTCKFQVEHTAIHGELSLNSDQQSIFDHIQKSNFTGLHVVTGGPGTGKTYLINKIVQHCTQTLRRHVLVTASTGIAASRLPGGLTVHSALRLGPGKKTTIQHNILPTGSAEYARCVASSVFIIDEAFMLTADLLQTVLSRFASVNEDIYFSEDILENKCIILLGDENQLPPVCNHNKREKPEHKEHAHDALSTLERMKSNLCRQCLTKNCHFFKFAHEHTLTVSERQRSDPEFAEFLQSILIAPPTQEDIRRVLGDCVLPCGNEVSDFKDSNGMLHDSWLEFLLKDGAISIHAHNSTVATFNNALLQAKYGSSNAIYDVDKVSNWEEVKQKNPAAARDRKAWCYDDKFHGLQKVAVGSRVICTENKNYGTTRIRNGTSARVVKVHTDPKTNSIFRIDVQLDTGSVAVPIYRTTEDCIHDGHTFKRKKFPLLLAHAMTIHKVQGSSLTAPTLMDFRNLFALGMGFVMLTRKTTRQDLKLTRLPTPEQLTIVRHVL